MAESIDVVDGKLRLRKTPAEVIETFSQAEVEEKIAQAQTKIDHLQINLAEWERDKAQWEERLNLLTK